VGDDRENPGLAYYIARPYWGRGLATEAACAFVDFGFAQLKLPRITATAEKGHRASERILESLGFMCSTRVPYAWHSSKPDHARWITRVSPHFPGQIGEYVDDPSRA
jgi:hypothetical protein